MSLKKKIPLIICIITVISLLITTIVTSIYCRKNMINLSKDSLKIASDKLANTINSTIKNQQNLVSIAANNDSCIKLLQYDFNNKKNDTSYKELITLNNNWLAHYVKTIGNLEHAYLVNTNGLVIADSNAGNIGLNVKDRDYNSKTLNGISSISKITKSKFTDKQIVIFTCPVKLGDKVIGYAANAVMADCFLGDISKDTSKTDYIYLLDNQGTLIYHPNKEIIGTTISIPTVKKIVDTSLDSKTSNSNFVKYKQNKIDTIAYYKVVDRTDWLMFGCENLESILTPINSLIRLIIIVGIMITIVTCLVGIAISKKITDPILNVTKLVNETSKLDLQRHVHDKDLDKSKDEMGGISKSIVCMRQNLREFVNSLITTSEDINTNAELVNGLTNDLKQYAEETSEDVENLTAAMEESAATIEQISASATEVDEAVTDMAKGATEGSMYASEIAAKANNIKNKSIESRKNAEDFYTNVRSELQRAIEQSKASAKVNDLAEAILGISEQTNLLALNAAIEAARAGDSGKGFAVVAEEIRKLAEESSNTAENIKNIVQIVNSSVDNLAKTSSNLLSFMDTDIENDYDRFIKTAESYNSDCNKFNEIIMDFSATAQELNASMDGISKAINEMSETINEAANGITNISNKSQNIAQKSESIRKRANSNKESANLLKNLTSKFKI